MQAGGGESPHECSRPVWDFAKDLFTRVEGSQLKREVSEVRDSQATEGVGPDGDGASGRWILPGDQGALPWDQRSCSFWAGSGGDPEQGCGRQIREKTDRDECFEN